MVCRRDDMNRQIILNKIIITTLLIAMFISIFGNTPYPEVDKFFGTTVYASEPVNRSKQLKVLGNKLVLAEDETEEVRLIGLNVPSLEWSNNGEQVYTSLRVACDEWNSNVIRVPLSVARWFGYANGQTNADGYRTIVDNMVNAVAERGKYIILDLHWSSAGLPDDSKNGQHKMPDLECKDFWIDVANRYKNNPAVLFNLYNEPHDVSVEVWRNGGMVTEGDITYEAVGHQQLVEAIRDTGAKNIIIAGGLNWGYSLSTIANGYVLVDQGTGGDKSKAGYGIMYDSHIYPWKGNTGKWDAYVGPMRKIAPIIAGENGWDGNGSDFKNNNVKPDSQEHLDHPFWIDELFTWFDSRKSSLGVEYGNQVHFTGWCFHPTATPRIIANWNYKPTDYWGAYLKKQLLSYPGHSSEPYKDISYANDFNPDVFTKYTFVKDGTNAVLNKENMDSGVKIKYHRPEDATKAIVLMEPPPQWIFTDIQYLQFKLQANTDAVGHTIRIGLEEADGDIWTADLTIQNENINSFNIPANQLVKLDESLGDGIYRGAIKNIYLSIESPGKGELILNDFIVNRYGSEVPPPVSVPYVERQFDYIIDFDNVFLKQTSHSDGTKPGDYFRGEVTDKGEGVDDTKGFKVSFKRASDSMGGNLCMELEKDADLRDAKYFSFKIRGDGIKTRQISMQIEYKIGGSTQKAPVTVHLDDDKWKEYTFHLGKDLYLCSPENISKIWFYNDIKGDEGYFIIDDITIGTTNKGLKKKVVVNDFENDPFVWSSLTSEEGFYFNIEDSGNGYQGNGKLISFKGKDAKGQAQIPKKWMEVQDARYMAFMIRGEHSESQYKLGISLQNGETNMLSFDVDISGEEWKQVIVPLMKGAELINAQDISKIIISNKQLQDEGKVVIDNIEFMNIKPVEKSDVSVQVIDTDAVIVTHQDFESEMTLTRPNEYELYLQENGNTVWTFTKTGKKTISQKFINSIKTDGYFTTGVTTLWDTNENAYIDEDTLEYKADTSSQITMKYDLPSKLTTENGIVTVEIKAKRPSVDIFDISLKSSSNKAIANITVEKNEKVSYKGYYVDGTKATAYTTNPLRPKEWICIRIKIDLLEQNIQLAYGSSFSEMKPWTETVDTFAFSSKDFIDDFSSITIGNKGEISFDDLIIYCTPKGSKPVADNIIIIGKPNIGETLTGIYGSYFDEDGDIETGSICEWIKADDPDFTKNVEIIKTESISAGETSTYTLTELERGKYIRFAVTPRNNADTVNEGDKVFSESTEAIGVLKVRVPNFMIGDTSINSTGIGEGGNIFGQVEIINTDSKTYNAVLVLGRYKDNGKKLLELVKSETITIPGCESAENGIVTVHLSTPYIAINSAHEGETLKLFVFNSLGELIPYVAAETIQ